MQREILLGIVTCLWVKAQTKAEGEVGFLNRGLGTCKIIEKFAIKRRKLWPKNASEFSSSSFKLSQDMEEFHFNNILPV